MFEHVAEALTARLVHNEVTSRDMNSALTHFWCVTLPDLTIIDVMEALREIVTPMEWVTTVILIDKLLERAGPVFSPHSCHRFIITACVISTKLHRDKSLNKEYGDLLRPDLHDVNAMERAFLGLIDWDMYIDRTVYEKVVRSLCATIQVAVSTKPAHLRRAVRCDQKERTVKERFSRKDGLPSFFSSSSVDSGNPVFNRLPNFDRLI